MVRDTGSLRPIGCSLAKRFSLAEDAVRCTLTVRRTSEEAGFGSSFLMLGARWPEEAGRDYRHGSADYCPWPKGASRRTTPGRSRSESKTWWRTQTKGRNRSRSGEGLAGTRRSAQSRRSGQCRCLVRAKPEQTPEGSFGAGAQCIQEYDQATAKKNRIAPFGNRKSFTGPSHPERDLQFQYIDAKREEFTSTGQPIISVDTKKKELIGNFANRGQLWSNAPLNVHAHDFRGDAECIAAPYGIFDPTRNSGFVFIGTSADTPTFAVDAVCCWWRCNQKHYSGAQKLLVLADSGGSNGCRSRVYKKMLQEKMADRFGIEVTVCHYPTGSSKWNPVEHKLFGPISGNWAGVPLRSLKLMVGLIKETTNDGGLTVGAKTTTKIYPKGIKVSNKEIKELALTHHDVCPKWNYTIRMRE